MINKYRYGNPFCTEAVVLDLPCEQGELPYFKVTKGEKLVLDYELADEDLVYGLGEAVRGINKRGWKYANCCTDDPNHAEDRESLYGAHNFLIIDGVKRFAIFIDCPGVVSFDIGYTSMNSLQITMDDLDVDLYIIEGKSLKEIVHNFRKMIGQSYIPPMWAFGYGQSRWSYYSEDEIREVVAEYKKNQIPIDSIYMDIDYMDRYKDFTVNSETFPNFSEFVHEMKEEGIHLVPIIDAGVKIEEGYSVYEEGVANNYFCKKEDGSNFKAGVWPGIVHFPDFMNKDARHWFGMKYKVLMDAGIDGFWNDMNEPAIFYSVDRLLQAFEELKKYENPDMDVNEFWDFMGVTRSIQNNRDDYKQFYHNVNGEMIRHDKLHNLYGYNMTRAAKEAFDEIDPDRRNLIFSRASYIGMHRYGGIWTGDNQSLWSHILLNLKMMPSLNMCGFLFTGADLGGFGGNTTEDLLIRWLQLGIFTPLMRNHSALGTRMQEVYRYEKKNVMRDIIGIRYGLIPYLYSEYMKAAVNNEMLFLPLHFEYENDEMAKQVEDQLCVGESIMIAPVYKQNETGRYVYLPEPMRMLRMKSLHDYESVAYEKGHHYIPVALDEVLIFIRPGKILPLAKEANNVSKIDTTKLTLFTYGDSNATYQLYKDDGYTKDIDFEQNVTTITIENHIAKTDSNIEVTIA